MHDPIGLPHELVAPSRLEHWLDQLAKGVALLGGLIFIALIVMSLVSIVGRKLNLLTVLGDIELMQAGTAVAVACFMPYCTLLGEHLRVEFFTENLPQRKQKIMDGIGSLLLTIVLGILVWRTTLQGLDMVNTGEVTTLLSLPMWVLVLLIVPPLALTVVCGVFRTLEDLRHPSAHLSTPDQKDPQA